MTMMVRLVVALLLTVWSASASERTLREVADYLRDGDNAMVRPSPSDTTAERQETEACDADLTRAYKTLTSSKDLKEKMEAAEVISLCTTNNPKNRAKFTTQKGVPEALVAMLKETPQAVAAAGECIWISTFSNKENYDAMVKAGAVDVLSAIVTGDECSEEYCHWAKMWAAAALQNLAATYCEGGPGYCDWEWKGEDKGADGVEVRFEVYLPAETKIKVDGTPVREALLKNKALIEQVSKDICDNVEHIEHLPEDRIWPSRAHVPDDVQSTNVPTILPWAYMGLLKNLAFAPGAYDVIGEETVHCICEYAVISPDWLEYAKAQDALWNLGIEYDELCEPAYDIDTCEDFEGWTDPDGNDCETFEEERWCVEFGDVVNSDGFSADEACCSCGGGNELHEEF